MEEQLQQLQEVVAKLQKELATIKGEWIVASEMLKQLTLSTDGKVPDAPKIPTQSFEVDDEEYLFTEATFNIRGLKRTALEALADNETYPQLGGKTIKEYLVASGSKLVKPVE